MASLPKMPQRIAHVYAQIVAHPDYKTKLDDATRWAFETGCVGGSPWCTKQNNQWSRQIWKYLYLGETSPSLGEP